MKIILLLVTVLSSVAFAGKAVNVADGSAAYCPDRADRGQNYVLNYEFYEGNLKIQSVVCENDQWVPNKGFIDRQYQAINGQKVHEKFKKFEIVLQSYDQKKYFIFSADDFEKLGSIVVTAAQLSVLNENQVDVNLRATRETTVDGKLQFVDPIWWGQIRVTLE